MSSDKINLVDLSRQQLVAMLTELGERDFRIKQLWGWIYRRGIDDFVHMTDLSKRLREYLAAGYEVSWPRVKERLDSPDGTCKWVVELRDGASVETVYIPDGNRGTVCVSSQVGCAVGCAFCATGGMGWRRNLTVSEIIGQLKIAIQYCSRDGCNSDHAVTNVVFMGMGEPLLNLDNVLAAIEIMLDDYGYGLSKYRVTVSSSGVVPKLYQLKEASEVAVAVSLHAANDQLRSRLVPMNQAYPIQRLLEVCNHYYKDAKRAVTIEYIMLDGINDSEKDAHMLAQLLSHGRYKINLIPFNAVNGASFSPSPMAQIDKFRDILMSYGIATITRRSRGASIAAACGQLVRPH